MRKQYRVVGTGNFEIVILGTGATTQGAKIEPDHTMAAPDGFYIAAENFDGTSLFSILTGHHAEIFKHFLLGGCIGREMENLDLLQCSQPVINTGIDLEDIKMFLQQCDGRQETLAMQSIRIKHLRWVI